MEFLLYYTILNLQPEADLTDIKKAYYRLAKENHPDHFPEECREIQELKMMQINEAYHYLTSLFKAQSEESADKGDRKKKKNTNIKYDYYWNKHIRNRYENLSSVKDIGEHRDPAYAYYKQGFVNFSKGLHGILSKPTKQYRADALSVIEWANSSIHHFHQAYNYFSRVVTEYPESIWHMDAGEKLKRIKNFNALYIKILHNMKARLGMR